MRTMVTGGGGAQTLDFRLVSEAASGFVCAVASEFSGTVLNVDFGSTFSVEYLVRFLGGEGA